MDTAVNWLKAIARLDNIALVVGVLVIGSLLLFTRSGSRWGRRWIVAAALAFWFVSTPFGSSALVAPMGHGFGRVTSPADAASAGAIVILGGGISEAAAGSDQLAFPVDTTALRTLEGARVFQLLGGRPIVVASGGRPRGRQRTSEGHVIATALVSLHVPPDHIVVDETSLTTRDQAVVVTRMLKARGIERFVLVTSPTHMWRSVSAFRAEHADVIPSVARAQSEDGDRWSLFMPNNDSLRLSDQAIYDCIATGYYWARGWFRP